MPQKLAEKVSVFGFDPALGVLVPTGSRAASPAAAKAEARRLRR
jgi:hypothetical protein